MYSSDTRRAVRKRNPLANLRRVRDSFREAARSLAGDDVSGYLIQIPPSTGMTTPVTYAAARDAR